MSCSHGGLKQRGTGQKCRPLPYQSDPAGRRGRSQGLCKLHIYQLPKYFRDEGVRPTRRNADLVLAFDPSSILPLPPGRKTHVESRTSRTHTSPSERLLGQPLPHHLLQRVGGRAPDPSTPEAPWAWSRHRAGTVMCLPAISKWRARQRQPLIAMVKTDGAKDAGCGAELREGDPAFTCLGPASR